MTRVDTSSPDFGELGEEPWSNDILSTHLYSAGRCVYCRVNPLDVWTDADEKCPATDAERKAIWTFDATRNDMADWQDREEAEWQTYLTELTTKALAAADTKGSRS